MMSQILECNASHSQQRARQSSPQNAHRCRPRGTTVDDPLSVERWFSNRGYVRESTTSAGLKDRVVNNGQVERPRARRQLSMTAVVSGSPQESVLSCATTTLPMALSQQTIEAALDDLSRRFAETQPAPEYTIDRSNLLMDERAHRWDEPARLRASLAERDLQRIVQGIREGERVNPELFGNVPSEAIPPSNFRDMGGRYLVNKDRVDRSRIYTIAKMMPKGAHLHLHFNSELPPEVLFPHARDKKMHNTLCIRSTLPLITKENFDETEIVFNVLPSNILHGDCLASSYNADWKAETNSSWMLWSDFRSMFPLRKPAGVKTEHSPDGLDDAECWAREKMINTVEHTYSEHQTHNGAWACFNQGTRAFKGLLNYESIYRWYIGHAIDNMILDKVMYAELRPMLMDKTIPSDDGTRQLDHFDQMSIICEEVRNKRVELERAGEIDKFPFGLKIIYCTPRSISKSRMQTELNDCLKLKLEFPDLICGFDLVGAEDRPNRIGFYADLLVAFTSTCKQYGVEIPFMFHAGETLLDTGGSSDPDNSNLYDSLLLNAKRIGHGYSLLKHPLLVERYKQANICLELCPISNELLHLCGNARQHPFPALLAAGLHCTLNADNPALFASSLSHEFYQVMVGDTRMSVHGWKQLAEWSIEHSCLTVEEQERGLKIFSRDWEAFCEKAVAQFGDDVDATSALP